MVLLLMAAAGIFFLFFVLFLFVSLELKVRLLLYGLAGWPKNAKCRKQNHDFATKILNVGSKTMIFDEN